MLFLGFISGKRIRFPGKWAKTFKNPGSLTSTQYMVYTLREPEELREIHSLEMIRSAWQPLGGAQRRTLGEFP